MARTRREFAGIIEVPQAAGYLRAAVRTQKTDYLPSSRHLMGWIRRGLSSRELVGVPRADMLIGFEDLISMRIISALRAARVPFSKIHLAEQTLRAITGKPRPFATEFLWTDNSDIFTEFRAVLMAVSRAGQYAFDFMRDELIPVSGLMYENNLAVSWEPREGILIHPRIQFGQSCIKGTRIPTSAVWGLVKSGDNRDFIAESYGIDSTEVSLAVEWEEDSKAA